ncbi:uncharacterized protein LOC107041723 [Diachasma alloeum]|uniref:uncharacterized protein LOC107041723 n=1 Tax=Diachasma alloeum TaxID=454923 RepID=UPI0007384C38|nr:uncharacterized protein LOC107041723 [Diachasma alloeum]
MNFLVKGACREIYTQRAQLLLPLFPPKPNEASLVPIINAHGNPLLSWKRLMSEDPSIIRNIDCPNPKCEAVKQRKVFTWFPDIQLVKRYGFKNLQNALRYHKTLWNIRCSCGGSRREEQISNFHIFLELDVRVAPTDPAQTCKLYDIPEILTFNREYRLAGIIAYDVKTDHYKAYCCRRPGSDGSISSCWEHHNGLASKVIPVRGNPEIQPECAIYVMAPDRR